MLKMQAFLVTLQYLAAFIRVLLMGLLALSHALPLFSSLSIIGKLSYANCPSFEIISK